MPYTDNPAGNPLDQVRFLVGDTSTSAPDLTDSEVAFLLDNENGNALQAAARAAEVLSSKYAKAASEKKVGPLSIMLGTRAITRSMEFRNLAKLLWSQAYSRSSVPFVGGIDKDDKASRAADSSVVQPAFKRKLMPYPQGLNAGNASEDDLLGGSNF